MMVYVSSFEKQAIAIVIEEMTNKIVSAPSSNEIK